MVNILICGTPGTGKSTLARAVCALEPRMTYLNIGEEVKARGLHDGYDAEWDSYILNEDKVIDEFEPLIQKGNVIVDHHSCDWFPERWFQLVVVLRCENDVLYPRLHARGYTDMKITENIESEIFQIILDEARDSYKPDIIWELNSSSVAEMEANTNRVLTWIQQHLPPR